MKQYHIFHATSPLRFTETEIQPREYVGFVEANSIEEAYIKSQNHSDSRWEKGNIWNTANPCRSTSIGDVIQDNNKFFMVCGIGFKELIEPEQDSAILDEYPPTITNSMEDDLAYQQGF